MVRVKGSFSAGGPKIKAPQYHAIISRMLQKQFVHSCTCSLVICYMCSFIFGSRKDFWSLFPWTWTGFRTLIIFAAIFPLYLNRKINLHVVPELRGSMMETAAFRLFSVRALRNVIAYSLSAAILCRIYLNNCSSGQAMGILVTHKSYELPRLNERWLYFHVLALYASLVASIRHILKDLDLLEIPISKDPIPDRLRSTAPEMSKTIAIMSCIQSFTAPLAYVLVRQPLFTRTLAVVKLVYRVPKSTALPGWPVGLQVMYHSMLLTVLMNILWTTLHVFFDIYLSQGPLRKGRLASEKSMQPDETLLNGLQQESKQLTRVLALEELEIISARDDLRKRRVGIYESGSSEAVIWAGIVNNCLGLLKECSMTISRAFNNGREQAPAAPVSVPKGPTSLNGTPPIQVRQANIFKTGVGKHSALEHLKSQPSSVAENQKQIADLKNLAVISQNWSYDWVASHVLKPLGNMWPTDNVTKTRRLTAKTFAGYRLQIMCISILTNLLLKSLEEDSFGRIHKDVARILLDYHALLSMVKAFGSRYDPKSDLQLHEVGELREALVSAISKVGLAFADFVDLRQYPGLWQQIQAGKNSHG